ncbi:MAG: hypothetical protein PF574_00325 [Candidatus Delongbacteria bacterium]|jgi:hypothetical protein|nr:hypothetical protein [Candidatus Delongbacteria bacterium]
MKKFTMWLILALVLSLFGQTAEGISNEEESKDEKKRAISYQSLIKNNEGQLIEDGKYNINFNLYSAENDEEPVWFENQNVVIKDGVLNALVGSNKKLQPELFKDQLWLTIELNEEESEMQYIAATSYSMYANRLDPDALVAGDRVALEELPNGKIRIDIDGPPNNPVMYISSLIFYGEDTDGKYKYLTMNSDSDTPIGSFMHNTGDLLYQGGDDFEDFVVCANDGRDLVLKSDPNSLGVTGKVYVGTKAKTNDLSISGKLIANNITSVLGGNIYIESIVTNTIPIDDVESVTRSGGNVYVGTTENTNNLIVNGSIYASKINADVKLDNLVLGTIADEYEYLSVNNIYSQSIGSFLWNKSSPSYKVGDDFEDFVISAKDGRDLVLMAEEGEFGLDRKVSIGTETLPNDLYVTGDLAVTATTSKFLKLGLHDEGVNGTYDIMKIRNNADEEIGAFMYNESLENFQGGLDGNDFVVYARDGRDLVLKSVGGSVFVGGKTESNDLFVTGNLTVDGVTNIGATNLTDIEVDDIKFGHIDDEGYEYTRMINQDDEYIGGFMYNTDIHNDTNPDDQIDGFEVYSQVGKDLVLRAANDGYTRSNVFVGSRNNKNDLYVCGTLTAEEINVKAYAWADYVFRDDYDLLSLSEVEDHINSYGYLPGMPSEKEVVENGLNINDMQLKLAEKIEELTLHMIRLEKENKELRNKIDSVIQ